MTSECNDFEKRIPQSLVGDLSPHDQEGLNRHLSACAPCREEHKRYAETLSVLRTSGDEPVPRHFFVYPQERVANPWQLFHQLMPRWKTAALGFVAILLMLVAATAGGLQIRSERGSWTVSFGRTSTPTGVDLAALKAEILQAADERNRNAALVWIANLRAEIGSRSNLSQEQQLQTLAALSGVEARLNNRISTTADEIRTGTEKANVDLYRAVSMERAQDTNRVNTRLDRVIDVNEAKARQTDEILETLLQIVSNLKQPGEQK